MNAFSCARLPQLLFGAGQLAQLPSLVSSRGWRRVALVTGGRSFRESSQWQKLREALEGAGIVAVDFSIAHEPDADFVDGTAETVREFDADAVIAIGGGSAIDAGKAVSAVAAMGGSVEDYLEGVGERKPSGAKLPFVAAPTTSGTGSEATKNAVISRVGPSGYKKSLRHDLFVPDIAIVDPQLSLHCPAGTTAASGLDAVTQLLEAYVSTGSNPVTDALAESGLSAAAGALLTAIRGAREGAEAAGGESAYLAARSAMAYAAYLSGVCLATAGLGIVHGVASPMGALYPVPHGVVCGTLLPGSVRATVEKLQRSGEGSTLKKYAQAALLLGVDGTLDPAGRCAGLVELLDSWLAYAGLEPLSHWGMDAEGARRIAEATSGKTHPAEFTADEVSALILERL
ncbi:iron-containing alcohol dehydrogenase [Salinispira pacifica]